MSANYIQGIKFTSGLLICVPVLSRKTLSIFSGSLSRKVVVFRAPVPGNPESSHDQYKWDIRCLSRKQNNIVREHYF